MNRHTKLWFVASLFAPILAGCGGGGGSGGGTAEGTLGAPATVTVGVARASSISASGRNFYKFVAASTATATISLTNTQSDLAWLLFSDAAHTNLIWICDNFFTTPGPADETCTTQALVSGATYYMRVDEWDDVAGTFTLLVAQP